MSGNMKFVAIFASLIVASVAGDAAEDLKMGEIALKCATENKVDLTRMSSEEAIEKMKKEPSFQCFTKCVLIKMEFTNENGEMNVDTVKTKVKLNDDQMKEVQECVAKQTQENSCEKLSAITDCIYMHEKKKA